MFSGPVKFSSHRALMRVEVVELKVHPIVSKSAKRRYRCHAAIQRSSSLSSLPSPRKLGHPTPRILVFPLRGVGLASESSVFNKTKRKVNLVQFAHFLQLHSENYFHFNFEVNSRNTCREININCRKCCKFQILIKCIIKEC